MRGARFDDAVGRRIQDWSSKAFDDEITAALEEFVGPERVMDDDDIQIFATWFHNDRELAGGGTPAELYAARPELPADEREVASRIATARLGLYHVLAVEPGRSLTLEHLLDGTRIGVRSPHVSRDAVRWDILLARVMDGDPPSLWGPTRLFEPCEEPELRAELARLAGSPLDDRDDQALAMTFRRHAHKLMRFLPSSRSAEPSRRRLPASCASIALGRRRAICDASTPTRSCSPRRAGSRSRAASRSARSKQQATRPV